ncbi:MAG: right-handed parallel beta-helix repeat-containing protein [Sedimentisphaerales bacterium]|nr:right-handed parallel beta-helix repeat-containing protein [Sedimentisphaerales bacterium]
MKLLETNQKMQTKKWGIKVPILWLCLSVGSTCPAKVIYVDADAAGANDGSSWADAYFYLQDALMFAIAGDEVHVAQGTYKPDDFVLSDRPSRGREETFQLINGVTLKGGYAGLGQADPDARDVSEYETILSGDLNGDDDDYRNGENSYHVGIASQTDPSAVLDGFTIMGGNANIDGLDDKQYGGGIYNESGSPTLIDCTFTSNSASLYDEPTLCGGGMANFNGSPTLTNCTFSDNRAGTGGGMYNYFSSVTLVNCTFTRNGRAGMVHYYSDVTALDCIFSDNEGCGSEGSDSSTYTFTNCIFIGNSETGMGVGSESTAMLTNCGFVRNSAYGAGGMSNGGTATLINCVFRENWADREGGGLYNGGNASLFGCLFIQNQATGSAYWSRGGAIYCGAGSITLIDCIFTGNEAHDYGGAIDTYESTLTMDNCTFAGNSANRSGGGLSTEWSTAEMDNCTFVGNSAPDGKALACDSFSQKYPSSLELTNCILWDGQSEIWNNDGSTVTVTYSDVQEDWPGEGNIEADPCFAEVGHWDANETPDDASDDFWVDGDYHLKSQAGRWDANEGRPTGPLRGWVTDDVTSPCIDAGDPASPIGDEPFPNGGRINMGAYGGTAEASKSYFGKEPCQTIVAGDVNGDCAVDFKDFMLMARHWLEEHDR